MLHYNGSSSNNVTVANGNGKKRNIAEESWKVLVLDSRSLKIIAPLFKPAELKQHGITIYPQLHAVRQSVLDAPAIYFISPTSENIQRIIQDIKNELYDCFYLNFTSSLGRENLEELAEFIAKNPQYSNSIAQVYDCCIDFVMLDRDLISLEKDFSYSLLSSPKTTEKEILDFVNCVALSLFNVFTAINSVPLIRYKKGTASEMIADKLMLVFKDYLVSSKRTTTEAKGNERVEEDEEDVDGESFSTTQAYLFDPDARPALFLVDRSLDLIPALSHSWSYAALLQDHFNMKLNRIIVKGKEVKDIDLDVEDEFWKANSQLPFPEVAENVDKALSSYKADMARLNPEASIAAGHSSDDFVKNVLSELSSAVSRKASIDNYMSLSMVLLNEIKERSLDVFVTSEESLDKLSKDSLLDIIKSKGNPRDKLRFYLIVMLSKAFSSATVAKAIDAVALDEAKEALLDLAKEEKEDYSKIIAYVKQHISLQQRSDNLSQSNSAYSPASSSAAILKGVQSGFDRLVTRQAVDPSNVFSNLMSSFKSILSEYRETPLIKTLEDMMTVGAEEEYGVADPMNPSIASSSSKKKGNISQQQRLNQGILFVVGGSNYHEYHTIKEYLKNDSRKKKIIFGSTEMLNAATFISQLKQLA